MPIPTDPAQLIKLIGWLAALGLVLIIASRTVGKVASKAGARL